VSEYARYQRPVLQWPRSRRCPQLGGKGLCYGLYAAVSCCGSYLGTQEIHRLSGSGKPVSLFDILRLAIVSAIRIGKELQRPNVLICERRVPLNIDPVSNSMAIHGCFGVFPPPRFLAPVSMIKAPPYLSGAPFTVAHGVRPAFITPCHLRVASPW
jgi:hypothetical protein